MALITLIQYFKATACRRHQPTWRVALLFILISGSCFGNQNTHTEPTEGSYHLHDFIRFFNNEWGPDAIMIVLTSNTGDIYQTELLDTLRNITDEIFFMPGVDRPSIQSLFTPNVRYINEPHTGSQGAPVISKDYEPSRSASIKIHSNVKRANIVGTLVSNDHKATAVIAKLLKKNPITREALEKQTVHNALKKIQHRFKRDEVRIELVGFGAQPPTHTTLTAETPPPTAEPISLDTVASYHWVQDLAICKTSWEETEYGSQEWLALEAHSKADLIYGEHEHAIPSKPIDILGFTVTHVSPGSFGMALGSMAFVSAPVAEVVTAVENWIGGRLTHCDSHQCRGYQLSERRHLMIFSEKSDDHLPRTVIGCYYRYQQ